ncbi:MAG: reductase [Solirubrobacteraceae bacterium]
MTEILAIVGSATRPGRLRRALADASAHPAEGVRVELLDLADVRIAAADGRPPEDLGDDTLHVLTAIERADAVVLATPVYRGSLTGVLKNLLDHVPVTALQGKPVGIVAMGATDHHFLGAERHLRDILAFFGALVAPVAVYLTSKDFVDGEPQAAAREALAELVATVAELSRAVTADGLRPPPLAARARRS